ncbi:SCO0607 family lipoprotein [Streptomyces sp. NPDC002526]
MRTAGSPRSLRTTAALTVSSAVFALLTSACSTADAVCSGGEYPVLYVGSTGGACVKDGEEPPKGYARYPEGKVPKHVDDKWWTYWNEHSLDKDGNIIEVSQ